MLSGQLFSMTHDPRWLLWNSELGTWKQIYAAPVPFECRFSFFQDGERLYGLTQLKASKEGIHYEFLVVDLRTGRAEKRQEKYDPKTMFSGIALSDNHLIGTRDGRLVRVEWPTLRETASAELRSEPWVSDIGLTLDRKRMVQIDGQTLVCRNVNDLSVLWTRQIDRDIEATSGSGGGVAAISADGSRVALAARRYNIVSDRARFSADVVYVIDEEPARCSQHARREFLRIRSWSAPQK